jgi:hypothetical protein
MADLWSALDNYAPDAFVAEIQRLADERPPGDAAALFEMGSVQDSTGHPELADLGREREALAHSLGALSAYLPRYNRSLARYAKRLADPQ